MRALVRIEGVIKVFKTSSIIYGSCQYTIRDAINYYRLGVVGRYESTYILGALFSCGLSAFIIGVRESLLLSKMNSAARSIELCMNFGVIGIQCARAKVTWFLCEQHRGIGTPRHGLAYV